MALLKKKAKQRKSAKLMFSECKPYPECCPNCCSDLIVDEKIMAQYKCLTVVSGYSGKVMHSPNCLIGSGAG